MVLLKFSKVDISRSCDTITEGNGASAFEKRVKEKTYSVILNEGQDVI